MMKKNSPHKRKTITWTPNAFLSSLGHDTTRASLLRRASIRRKCIRTGPPTTVNTWDTSGAHEHILTALQRLFTKAGYRTDRKHVTHSRGLKKADLLIKDFQLQGVRDVIVCVTCRHEFHGSCATKYLFYNEVWFITCVVLCLPV